MMDKVDLMDIPSLYQMKGLIIDRDWGKWDRQIEEDSDAGRLDFLAREALSEKKEGELDILAGGLRCLYEFRMSRQNISFT